MNINENINYFVLDFNKLIVERSNKLNINLYINNICIENYQIYSHIFAIAIYVNTQSSIKETYKNINLNIIMN